MNRITSVVLVGILAVILTGCGNSAKTDESVGAPAKEEVQKIYHLYLFHEGRVFHGTAHVSYHGAAYYDCIDLNYLSSSRVVETWKNQYGELFSVFPGEKGLVLVTPHQLSLSSSSEVIEMD